MAIVTLASGISRVPVGFLAVVLCGCRCRSRRSLQGLPGCGAGRWPGSLSGCRDVGESVRGARGGDLAGYVPPADVVRKSWRVWRDAGDNKAPLQNFKGFGLLIGKGQEMQTVLGNGGLVVLNFPIFGLVILGLILIIIQRKRGRGRGQGNSHFKPNGFGGVVGADVGVDSGKKVGGSDGKGDSSGDDVPIGQGASLAGQIDVLPGASDGARAVAVAAGHPAQGIQRADECGQVVRHGEHRKECLQVVDNDHSKIRPTRPRKQTCYARSVTAKRRPGVHVVSLAALRAVLVAIDWGIEIGRRGAVPASVTGRAWARVFEGYGVVAFERPIDAPELMAAGACAWSPGGGFPATVRRGG